MNVTSFIFFNTADKVHLSSCCSLLLSVCCDLSKICHLPHCFFKMLWAGLGHTLRRDLPKHFCLQFWALWAQGSLGFSSPSSHYSIQGRYSGLSILNCVAFFSLFISKVPCCDMQSRQTPASEEGEGIFGFQVKSKETTTLVSSRSATPRSTGWNLSLIRKTRDKKMAFAQLCRDRWQLSWSAANPLLESELGSG